MNNSRLDVFLRNAIQEDIGNGDHTSLACIPKNKTGKAQLIIKENGILAGVQTAEKVFRLIDSGVTIRFFIPDGSEIKKGDIAFIVQGRIHSLLQSERLVLNIMQRMSGIATQTRRYVNEVKGYKARILDTRKTTPGMRMLEKEAVCIGGGVNHRIGLYDMILIKDNHIDYAGSIEKAILRTHKYLKTLKKILKIEIEARTLDDVDTILQTGGIDRILLDNFSIPVTRKAVKKIAGKYEVESSGGITLKNVKEYAVCGVDFISVGALTHQIKSLDMSLKAI